MKKKSVILVIIIFLSSLIYSCADFTPIHGGKAVSEINIAKTIINADDDIKTILTRLFNRLQTQQNEGKKYILEIDVHKEKKIKSKDKNGNPKVYETSLFFTVNIKNQSENITKFEKIIVESFFFKALDSPSSFL